MESIFLSVERLTSVFHSLRFVMEIGRLIPMVFTVNSRSSEVEIKRECGEGSFGVLFFVTVLHHSPY